MSVSNYILNQRISALQYQINKLQDEITHLPLEEVLSYGNSAGNNNIDMNNNNIDNVNNINTNKINNVSYPIIPSLQQVLSIGNVAGSKLNMNNYSILNSYNIDVHNNIEVSNNGYNSILSSRDLKFNGVSILIPPKSIAELNFVLTSDITINGLYYYTSSFYNNVNYLDPSNPIINITLNTQQTQYILLNLNYGKATSFTVWTHLNNYISSTQVYLSCDTNYLYLNVPVSFSTGDYTFNLPSFNYII